MDAPAAAPSTDDARDLSAAATAHAAREQILSALGDLAARPLDEHAAQRMRQALAQAGSVVVREALTHLETVAPAPADGSSPAAVRRALGAPGRRLHAVSGDAQ